MSGLRIVIGAAVLLAAALGAARPAPAAEPQSIYARMGPIDVLGNGPNLVELGVGAFNVLGRYGDPSPAGMVELRFGAKFYFVGTALGLVANTEEALFGYIGVYTDLVWGRFIATPVLAIGGYKQGHSLDLHEIFEFRTGLDLAYRVGKKSRVGIHVAHVSNADIVPSNPGEEEVYFIYGFGF